MRNVTFSHAVPWPRPGWLLDLALSPSWVGRSRASGEGNVLTVSERQWKRIPRPKGAALSWLPEEMMFLLSHVHMYLQACIFPRNFWTWGSIATEMDGGKVRIPEISSNCLLKIGGLQKRDLIASSARQGGSESPLLLEQWRIDTMEELRKSPPNSTKEKNAAGFFYLPRQTSFTC